MDRMFVHAHDWKPSESFLPRVFRFYRLPVLASLCLLAPQLLRAQAQPAPTQALGTSELFFQDYTSYGCFKFLGGETRAYIYYGGVEYDRHNLGSHLSLLGHYLNYPGRLMHARVDYAAEFLPVVILSEPTVTDKWGDPLSPYQKLVPGMAITPLGFRWLWFDGKFIKPLFTVKLGGVVFTQKALSTTATYANFTINASTGVQIRLARRTDLRVGWEFHHFSNAYVNGSDPGLDTLGVNFGIVFHLRASSKW